MLSNDQATLLAALAAVVGALRAAAITGIVARRITNREIRSQRDLADESLGVGFEAAYGPTQGPDHMGPVPSGFG